MKKHLKKFKSKPLSWSSISSWKYNKQEWASKYLLGIQQKTNEKMEFGKRVGELLANLPQGAFLPEVPRYPIFEHKLEFKIGKIPIIGYIDSFNDSPVAMLEYKTSSNDLKWTQKSANDHGQLMLYIAGLWLKYDVHPENIPCHLVWIPVDEDFDGKLKLSKRKPEIFEVKKTKIEVLNFLSEVQSIYEEMCEFALNYKED